MPQLPHACPEEGHELGQAPVHGPRVGLFAQCPELGLAFPLELLLASDVGEAVVELAHLEDETTRKAGSARSRDRRLETRGRTLALRSLTCSRSPSSSTLASPTAMSRCIRTCGVENHPPV